MFKYNQIPTPDNKIKAKERNASAENKEALSTRNASVNASPYCASFKPWKLKKVFGIKANIKHKPPTIPKAYLKDFMTTLVFPSLIILLSDRIPKNGISNSTITNVVETVLNLL